MSCGGCGKLEPDPIHSAGWRTFVEWVLKEREDKPGLCPGYDERGKTAPVMCGQPTGHNGECFIYIRMMSFNNASPGPLPGFDAVEMPPDGSSDGTAEAADASPNADNPVGPGE